MKAILILGTVLLVLLLLSQVRLGALVEYSAPGLSVRIKLGPLRLFLYPPRPRQRRSKGKRKAKEETPQPEAKGGSLEQLKQILPLIADGAGRLRRRIRIDHFYLDVTAAAGDPAAAALLFGGANAAIGMLWPLVEQNFKVKERQLRTRVDFAAARPSVDLRAAATLTVGQALSLGLRLAVQFFHVNSSKRAAAKRPAADKQKEAV